LEDNIKIDHQEKEWELDLIELAPDQDIGGL
jgi:hypothetical protein